MSIIVGEDTKLVLSGLTGREGSFHGLRNRNYGTDVVAGVTPKKGGQDVEGIPIFDTIEEAVDQRGANTSMIFVPARFAAAAMDEAIDAGIGTESALSFRDYDIYLSVIYAKSVRKPDWIEEGNGFRFSIRTVR